jgi:hypothetical protein
VLVEPAPDGGKQPIRKHVHVGVHHRRQRRWQAWTFFVVERSHRRGQEAVGAAGSHEERRLKA